MKQPPGSNTSSEADTEVSGTPRWVKVFGSIALVIAVLAVVLVVAGHDPGRHASERPIALGEALSLGR